MFEVVIIVLLFALGSMVQTVAGFGSALVIMPVLTQVVGVRTAAPVQILVGFTVTMIVLYQNRHALQWREAARLIAGSVVGVPVGTLVLRSFPSTPVTACLGVLLVGYAAFEFRVAPRFRSAVAFEGSTCPASAAWKARAVSGFVGFCSGVLGGAYATDGPPLIIYGSVKRWPKATFKSVLQSCFLVNGLCMVCCHGASGLITRQVVMYSLYAIPGMFAGVAAGTLLDRHVDHARFRRLLLWLILVLGTALFARSLIGGRQ